MVKHIKIVAILLLVEGCLEAVPGVVLTGMGLLAAFGMTTRGVGAREFPMELGLVVLLYAPLLLALAGFRIWTGILNQGLRSRAQGIWALAAGALAFPSCYCAPTSLALLVYGLVIYLNPEVVAE